MTLTIRTSRPEDATELAPELREEDKLEILLATGSSDLAAALAQAIGLSSLERITLLEDGKVIAVGGLVPGPFGASPWMLGSARTTASLKNILFILYQAKEYTDRWLREHGRLTNITLTLNTTHLNWLKKLGFTLGAPFRAGPYGASVTPFYKEPLQCA